MNMKNGVIYRTSRYGRFPVQKSNAGWDYLSRRLQRGGGTGFRAGGRGRGRQLEAALGAHAPSARPGGRWRGKLPSWTGLPRDRKIGRISKMTCMQMLEILKHITNMLILYNIGFDTAENEPSKVCCKSLTNYNTF